LTKCAALICLATLFGFIVSAPHSAEASETEIRAAEIYAQTCIVCHAEGVGGAPRPGVTSDWQSRLEYGIEELYYNTIEGLGAEMPPRGLCDSCSEDELGATVDYMLRDVK